MFLLLPFVFLVAAIALPLAKRDVVDPPILYPNATTVWLVGQKQTVTWNTTGLPTQQSNPLGQLVLGYLYNNSENLMLGSPLATNINYTVGKAEITVPNVPTRMDYILVLFGDSGNASPQFTITNKPDSSISVPPSSATESESSSSSPGLSSPAASMPLSTPSPVSPNTPGSGSSPTPVNASTGSQVAGALPTPTALSSSATVTSRSSTIVTVTASTTATTAKSNASGQKHASSLTTFLGVALTALYFAFS